MGDMSINNIRYADDTTLVELVFEKLQISTSELDKACSRWGMKVNHTKCKVMTEDPRDITLNEVPIDKVNDFVFLGSNVPSGGGCQAAHQIGSLGIWQIGKYCLVQS